MTLKPDHYIASLYGGLFIATVWAIPGLNFLNCLCCAGVLLGGFLSVLIYQKDITPEMEPLTRDDCVRLGMYAGIISSVAGAIIQFVVLLMFGNIAIDMMMHLADSMQVQFPPELYEMVEQAKQEEERKKAALAKQAEEQEKKHT